MKTNILKKQLKNAKVVKNRNLNSSQFFDAVLQYQDILGKSILEKRDGFVRFGDVKKHLLEELGDASDKYTNLFEQLDALDKYSAISMAGYTGEALVKKSLIRVNRKHYALSGITLDEDGERTEYDQIIITDKGILILEVKNYKSPFIINRDGTPTDINGNPIAKNILTRMHIKRKLLINKLIAKFREKGIDMPLYVDEFLVFAKERNEFRNLATGLKYTKPSKLPSVIDGFSSTVEYTDDQMQTLERLIYEVNQEEYKKPSFDFEQINKDLVNAIVSIERKHVFEKIKSYFVSLFQTFTKTYNYNN